MTAGCTGAAANSAGVWVQVSPSTVHAGTAVGIRASCGDSLNPATVSSPLFASITISPVNGVYTSTAQVPPDAKPGTTKVTLTCSTGSRATTTITVLEPTANRQPPPGAMGPHTGGGFLAADKGGLDSGTLLWLGVGISAFLAAAAVGLRARGVRPLRRPVTGRRTSLRR